MEDRQTEINFVSQKCPVCNGFGTLKYGSITCKACNGKGFIVINNKTGLPVEVKKERKKENEN